MQNRLIPSDQWISFFDQFSRDHVGWAASIEILDQVAGPQTIANDLPLQGVSFDTHGTRASSLIISVGDEASRHVDHVIDKPLHIREALGLSDAVDIQIEPAQGAVTLIHLKGPAN